MVTTGNNSNNNMYSPSHFSLAGTFSADEIQDLLGAMAGEIHPHRPSSHSTTTTTSSDDGGQPDLDLTSVVHPPPPPPDDEDGTITVDDDAKMQARSERKRSRERQRRCDVNKHFADLTAVLTQIEAEEAEEDNTVVRLAFSPANRVDLIARTITHLERLNASNKRRKKEVESLQQQLDQAKKAGEDTAAKLKEVMFNQPPQTKQVRSLPKRYHSHPVIHIRKYL
jgi:hypothetical protein